MTNQPVDYPELIIRLLAALVVKEDDLPSGAAKLRSLGLPATEIAPVLALTRESGLSQKETIERLLDLGFETGAIAQVTGYLPSSVVPTASRYRKARQSLTQPDKRDQDSNEVSTDVI